MRRWSSRRPSPSPSRTCFSAAGISGLTTTALLTDPGAELPAAERLEAAAERLAAGEPLQYVLGEAGFCGRPFVVRPGVLIPRPETEELVAWVLRDEVRSRRLLDVGTGSGCIAVSLALGLPGAELFAADLSDEALAVAAENARRLGARVTLRRADALHGLADAFPERFDAIVSNPPYVPESDRAAMHPNVRDHEPGMALFVPDDDRILFYRAIARAGRRLLLPGGRLYFEIYEHAAEETAQMLRQEAPDVMGVQEAMQDQLYYIDTECPRYARVGEDRDGGAEGGETMAVFYLRDRFELLDSGTFWISETPDNVSRGWDAACNRTVTWVELRDKSSGKEFFYFNTHLDHQGKIAREEGVKLIVTKIRQIAGKKAAVILGGDLNTSIDNPHLKPLTRLMASARDTAAETDQKGTFNGFGSAPDTIILDHLFYRGRMKCRKFVTLDGDYGAPYISDHYPIAMVFTL